MSQSPDTPIHRCDTCGDERPLTDKWFRRLEPSRVNSSIGVNGFYRTCRKCRRKQKLAYIAQAKDAKEQEAIERHVYWLAKLKGKQLSAVQHVISGTRSEQIHHIAEIYEALMNMFGGPVGYAESLMSDYISAKEGSVQRMQLHKVIQSYAAKVTESGAAKMPIEHMSEEELSREIEKRTKLQLRLMVESGKVHDVYPESPPMKEAANG